MPSSMIEALLSSKNGTISVMSVGVTDGSPPRRA